MCVYSVNVYLLLHFLTESLNSYSVFHYVDTPYLTNPLWLAFKLLLIFCILVHTFLYICLIVLLGKFLKV